MACKSVITIGRQYGSGGREIGQKLAGRLGIKCYDNELLDRAAKESGICQELFENHDEKPTNSFLYSLVMDTYSMGYASAALSGMPINHKVFLARCADYALDDYPNRISVFIYGSMDKRIRRIADKYNFTDAKAKDVITKTDKQRASYYNYYTNKRWGDIASYDLCINSSILGIDGTVEILRQFIEEREALNAK